MEDELMGMEVAPVMEPQSMPQGTPAASVLPQELQASIDSLSEEEKAQAKQALMQIMRIVEQMEADGATPEQIEQFLNEIGMTLEELEMAEEMFGMGEGALGFTRPVSRFEDDFNRMRLPRNAPLGLERLFGRLQERIRNNPKFQGIRRMPMPVGGGVPFAPPMMPSNMMAAPALPMPQTIPTERFPMIRPGFAEGEEVRSGMRSGSTGPRVQNLSNQVLKRPPLGSTISAAARGAAMSPIARFGIPGAIAAGGIALYQIADETGMVPEEIGRGAASLQKSFQDVVSEAVEMAQNIGAPVIDFVERVKMGYRQEMSAGMPEPDPASYQTAEPRDILDETGRTISNIDRQMLSPRTISNIDREMLGLMPLEPMLPPPPPPIMGEVPMFAEGLAVDIENLEKKN